MKVSVKKEKAAEKRLLFNKNLLFDDLKNFHGASLHADAAGDALGNGILCLMYHDLHGAHLNTLTTTNAVLFADHIDTGLGVLGNGLMLTDLHALATLDADIGLGTAGLTGNDLNAGIIGMELLVESLGASLHALQTSHTFHIFLYSKLLHNKGFSFM